MTSKVRNYNGHIKDIFGMRLVETNDSNENKY